MFIRFIAPWRLRRGIDQGLFGPAYSALAAASVPEILRLAIRHELDWFEDALPVPRGRDFCVRSRKHWVSHGICWFRAEAGEMISRAHGLAALLDAAGLPVARLKTRRPGQILYRDPWQVIAKPDAATPTLWR
jgi:hypothetical protein